MKTITDRSILVQKGLNIASKHILLCSEYKSSQVKSIKVMLKDLPLHSISNEEVLEAMKEECQVQLEIRYANVWYEGYLTGIRNGDRYCYVANSDLSKLPEVLQVGDHQARVFKPVALSMCKCCNQVGHHSSDPKCPAHAPEIMMDTVEPFRGGKCELSNLHVCVQGCVIEDKVTIFPLSEHHYQFKKLKHHDKGDMAYEMLLQEDTFKAMKMAK